MRPRLSRIYYNRKFFNYPLKPLNALGGLGVVQSLLVVLSYLRWQLFPHRHEETFEEWVTNRFGRRLFMTFFKSYTEKVWGISTSELKAEWAVQRIMNLSLTTAVIKMFLKGGNTVKSLIEEFHYPRYGPGMMWKAVKERVENAGGVVQLESEVIGIKRRDNRIDSLTVSHNGNKHVVHGTDFISSMPLTEFIKRLDPPPPIRVLEAAKRLRHRDFLTVCLIVDQPDLFPDNWIYVHDPEVKVGRIQNFKNWSPDMVPDSGVTTLGLEYFCNAGDDLWQTSDDDLIELGKREVHKIGLARYEDVKDGCVFRVPYSYPVYDSDYSEYLETVRDFVDGLENFQTVGRNGLHRYNNQDHAMLTGMLAVRNLIHGERNNLWVVNAEQEYHEELSGDPRASIEEIRGAVQKVVSEVFSRLDSTAFGLSVGAAAGIILFLATIVLVLKGGPVVGPRLGLLVQYFPGYSVTPLGGLIGLVYGFLAGFVLGWGAAFLRNLLMFFYIVTIKRGTERHHLRRFFDYI